MSLPALLDGVSLPADVAAAIADLRARKAVGLEAGKGERVPALDAFCAARMDWARAHLPAAAPGVDPALRAAAAALFHASVFGHPAPA
jgi:predicted nucleotidyltransferase